MFRYLRQRTFAFAGAYALVTFYNSAQCELSGPDGHVVASRVKVNPQPKISWMPAFATGHPPPKPVARPSDDLKYYVVEYDVQAALVVALCVMAGGWCAMAGAAAALVLECSDDGPQTYAGLKEEVGGEVKRLR
jgi:hypothetical protein